MKLLLDENLPHDLRHSLPGHDVYTVAFMGWSGVTNGVLLGKAGESAFDAVLSKDSGIEHEQSLTRLPVAVVLLRAKSNAMDDIRPLVPALLAALDTLAPRSLTIVG